ncbi:hypothetical protein J7399_20230 [Shimia sp. R9_1]|uniref:hypothetical protein n=1 Tax=Shimia sp. R9_1 TaxID=2821111 RepID=UPI001ADD597D|nr:hypothetical protein [Shimia sp. R9_1]MBO9409774.1 hypothetical protein [Shimia sp. R9_1]
MAKASLWNVANGIPKLIIGTAIHPLLRALRGPMEQPLTQSELAKLVNQTRVHEIRAGYTHRFIRLMFVTVDDRVFCRRYQYGKRSWHSVFLSDSGGQLRLDDVVANIDAAPPRDMDGIIPAVDQAYADALKKLEASFMLSGAVKNGRKTAPWRFFCGRTSCHRKGA